MKIADKIIGRIIKDTKSNNNIQLPKGLEKISNNDLIRLSRSRIQYLGYLTPATEGIKHLKLKHGDIISNKYRTGYWKIIDE